MGFVSFVGRVLFASVFLLSAYQEFSEFGTDGGPAAKALKPKFDILTKNINSYLGVALPPIDMKPVIMAAIALKGLGGLLFILNSNVGHFLLILYLHFFTPIVYDFYNYDTGSTEYVQLFIMFNQNVALFGALEFSLGMKNSIGMHAFKKKGPKSKTN
ncbi:HR-like lesion-inducing protein-like protein [Rhynchospora pubera]|uniref:HR-like lesion-inducing protein-like protein n=1 Tax=Rhynchospora pubera TaxID=906938 RepID=A0AAV8GDZ7_9POAL|nr:HR-like lesion-inducing protein-like protein [Rhynchospora pubera]